jgi:hypothetical protein
LHRQNVPVAGQWTSDTSNHRITLSHSFASTSIAHRLVLFTSEGEFRGEISSVDPDSHEFIDDSFPYSMVIGILNEQNNET